MRMVCSLGASVVVHHRLRTFAWRSGQTWFRIMTMHRCSIDVISASVSLVGGGRR